MYHLSFSTSLYPFLFTLSLYLWVDEEGSITKRIVQAVGFHSLMKTLQEECDTIDSLAEGCTASTLPAFWHCLFILVNCTSRELKQYRLC